ncbi:MAG: GNAT family N-acetyltransferase [Clostridiales bacterium]|jgi:ribosomal protein S18 acetylase RimI-like enzyme|nr:GNAT family N-acetyltransferase [Clostridiales bacterium]
MAISSNNQKTVDIRQMAPEDYAQVYNLWISTPGMGLNNVDDSPEGISRLIKRNPTTCLVALSEGEIIGVILCGHDGRRAYIYHTAVKVSERGRGVGRALVERLLDALRKESISKVALVVFTRNDSGNQFWEKLGFKARNDLVYRNLAIATLTRIDT